MKNLFYKLLYLSPLLIVVVAVNWWVDPANLFRAKVFEGDDVSYEQQLVNYVNEGYNITNLDQYSERLFQKNFIESMEVAPEVAVLGSSKSLMLGEDLIPDKLIRNNSLTGATLEDIIALLGVYDAKQMLPSKLYVELSPYLFNENNSQTRWEALKPEYEWMVQKLTGAKDSVAVNSVLEISPEYYELISFEYFQESMKKVFFEQAAAVPFLFAEDEFVDPYNADSLCKQFVAAGFTLAFDESGSKLEFLNQVLCISDLYEQWSRLFAEIPLMDEDMELVNETLAYGSRGFDDLSQTEQENVIKRNRKLLEATFWEHCPVASSVATFKTKNKENTNLTLLTDGTIVYPKDFRNRSVQSVAYSARASLNHLLGLDNFSEISDKQIGLLKKMLLYLKENKVEVKLLLVPYHPVVFDEITKNDKYKNVIAVEKTLRQIASENKLPVYGSYSPDVAVVQDEAFYDGAHVKKEYLKTILKLSSHD